MQNEFTSLVVGELEELLGISVELPSEYELAISRLGVFLSEKKLVSKAVRRQRFLAKINWKFRVNVPAISHVYAKAAKSGITFNFHQKNEISSAFDSSSIEIFSKVLSDRGVSKELGLELLSLFVPASPQETIDSLKSELLQPSKLRNDRAGDEVKSQIILSAIVALAYSFADERIMHSYFDKDFNEENYDPDFWVQLRKTHPELYSRNHTLDFINVAEFASLGLDSYKALRAQVLQYVMSSYTALNNHGYLALWLGPVEYEGRSVAWELASDVILFAEKFDECDLKKGYFRPSKIEKETASYIDGVSLALARFEVANEGFSYRDTFVCSSSGRKNFGSESLLILLQKNKRDETLVPCPSCRSHDVGGNSYPSLGVKSWECGNLLCPDKSKYNRGKRYSFKSLLMQEAIDDESNEITHELVRGWSKDVQPGRDVNSALEMAIRFYSLYGDCVHVYGLGKADSGLGRTVKFHNIDKVEESEVVTRFWDSAWFHRYIVEDTREPSPVDLDTFTKGDFEIAHGDARSALMRIGRARFDGAITSPPYYNAREYSQWPNIYCYMYDMYNIALGVYRALKPGALYLYNIFDYFDNENSLAHSAMGTKRIPLSAYSVDAFRRAGFVLVGNITWDKGDIEGKRGFNAGNFSPYYQAPFNCWEHILVFSKGTLDSETLSGLREKLVSVLQASPVIKMIRGENMHGHTAPFPEELPDLVSKILPPGTTVLDPFGGSGTTARALVPKGYNVTCVERDVSYCELSRRLFDQKESVKASQLNLKI